MNESTEELRYFEIDYKNKKIAIAITSEEMDRLFLGESRLNRELIEVMVLDTLYGFLVVNTDRSYNYAINGFSCIENPLPTLKYKFYWDYELEPILNDVLNETIAMRSEIYVANGNNRRFIAAEEVTSLREIVQSIIIGNKALAESMLKEAMEKTRNVT